VSGADRLLVLALLGLAVAGVVGAIGGGNRAVRGLTGLLVFLAVCVLIASFVTRARYGAH
jgi:hypothetical protein